MTLWWGSLLWVAGLAAGLLGGLLGVGGGILVVPVLLWVMPQIQSHAADVAHYAVASSLVSVVVTQLAGVLAHRKRRTIVYRLVLWAGPAAAVAGWLGAAMAARLSGPWLVRIFAVLLLLIAAQLFVKGEGVEWDPDACAAAAKGEKIPHFLCLLGGLVTGFLAGLLGIGGGIVAVPYFHFVLGLDLRRAMATALPVGLFGSVFGVSKHLLAVPAGEALANSTGFVYWPVALVVSAGSVIGGPLGVRLSARANPGWLRKFFAVLMIAAAAQLLLN